MKPLWRYTYRTSDGAWHTASVRAADRDAAFAELRKCGVKPVKVELASGLLNSLRALGRRWYAIIVLALALAATLAYTITGGSQSPATATPPPPATAAPPSSPIPAEPRHQVAGLPSDWISRLGDFFDPTDAYLALFAQPGCIDGMDIVPSPDAFTESSFSEPLTPVTEADPAWIVEMKSILVGMKEEALTLAKGGKASQEIILWLRERQRMEAGYRAQILAGDGTDAEKAARLAAVGLQPLAPIR